MLQSAKASQSGSNIEQCAARYDRSGAILINSIVNGSIVTIIAMVAISSVSIAAIG